MELLQLVLKKATAFDDHLVVILQLPLVDKALVMNVSYVLWKAFHYSLEGEYLVLFSNGDYATIPSKHNILTFVFTQGYTC